MNWRMPSSGMLRRVALVRTDVSEELRASVISVITIGELGTTLAVTTSSQRASVASYGNVVPSSPIFGTLMMEALSSSETSVLKRATRRNIPEDDIFHSHCREDLKSYIIEVPFIWLKSRFASYVVSFLKNGVFWVVTPCGSYKNRRWYFFAAYVGC
jgi:hypothetical protein